MTDDAQALFALLKETTDVDREVLTAIRETVASAPDYKLSRINALAFAAEHGLDEERDRSRRSCTPPRSACSICPGTCSARAAAACSTPTATLKTVHSEDYVCSLCAAGYEPTLDEMVEVTFTVSPRVRRIAAHDPHELPPHEYFRQIYLEFRRRRCPTRTSTR